MKREIKCDPKKGGCGSVYGVKEENVEREKYIQCPFCSRIAPNPLYKGEEHET